MKISTKPALIVMAVTAFLAMPACKYLWKSEFTAIVATDLTSIVDSRVPEPEKRRLAQNEVGRKKLIQDLKQVFALAQAAEADGIHKSDRFKREMVLSLDQVLAREFTKRNREVTVSKEELDAYFAAHKEAFETDFKLITQNQKPVPTAEQKEASKPQWSEIKVRADKARQAGIEKEPGYGIEAKVNKAYLLASLYTESLEEKFKPSPEEKSKYLAEHPEADMEKLQQKAQDVLDRIKKGESFEKFADELNPDGTKGKGGDLSWFGKGAMDPIFEKAAFSLDKGQTSPELVKTRFGFHIIRVDDKRKTTPKNAAPNLPIGQADLLKPQPAATEPQDEVKARHILISTQAADEFEKKLVGEKVKRALEDAEIKYAVTTPEDFKINVAGLDPNRIPGAGGGIGGAMQGPTPAK